MSTRRLNLVLDLDTGTYSGRLSQAGVQMKTFAGTVDKTSGSVRQFGDSFNRMGGSMQTPLQKLRDYVLVLGNLRLALLNVRDLAVGWVAGLLKQAGEMERLTLLMKGLSKETTDLGKNKEAAQSLQDMMSMARRTGFEVKTLTDAFVKFKSAGLDPKKYSLGGLVEAVAAFGGDSDILHRASIAIQQMAGKGVISMEELRQQLGEAVPTAMRIMAHAAGETMAEFTKQVSKGRVQAKPLIEAMLRDMETLYAGSGARLANSLFGQAAQFRTNMMQLASDFSGMGKTDGLFSTTVTSLKQLNEMLRSADGRKFMEDLGNGIASIASSLASATRVAVVWHSEIGSALKGLIAIMLAIKVRDVAQWTFGLAQTARQSAASWLGAFGSMAQATRDLGKAVTGNASIFSTAKTMELAATKSAIDASERTVLAARTEMYAKAGLANVAKAEVAAAQENIASKEAEIVAANERVTALNAERLAAVQNINAKRVGIADARSAIAIAIRDNELQGYSRASTQALARARNDMWVAENRLSEAVAERIAIEERLAAAVEGVAKAERDAAAAKVQAATATRGAAAADVEEAVAADRLAMAQEGAAATSNSLTLSLRMQAAASAAGAAAVGFLRGGLALLSNPLTMVAGGLLYAAYAAGVFSNKSREASDAAIQLKKDMGDLAQVKSAAGRIDEINATLAKQGVRGAIKEKGVLGYLSSGVFVTPEEKAKLVAERDDLIKTLNEKSPGAYGRSGSNATQSDGNRRAQWAATMAAELQATIEREKLNDRMEAGDKAAFARYETLQSGVRARMLSRDQTMVSGMTALWEKAKTVGDKNGAAYWAQRLVGAKQQLEQTKSTINSATSSTQALADATGQGGVKLDKFGRIAASADGTIAQMTARLSGANGAVAKFNAELAGGKYAGAPDEVIEKLRDAAVATDALAASKAAAAEDNRFESKLSSMVGRLAQMKDSLEDGKGELAKFNAELAAGSYKGMSPKQIGQLRSIASNMDDTAKDQGVHKVMEDLDKQFAKAQTDAASVWTSFNRGSLEADQRLAQVQARFADKLIGLTGDDLDLAKRKIDAIVDALNRADAADTVYNWQQQSQAVIAGLQSEEAARQQAYERERARQQSLLDQILANTQMSVDEKRRAEMSFGAWDRAQKQKLARENEGAVLKMARDWSNLGQNVQSSMSQALGSVVDGLTGTKLNVAKMTEDILKSLMKVILEAMVAYAILSAMGMANNSAGEHVSMSSFLKGQLGAGMNVGGSGTNSATAIGYKGGIQPMDISLGSNPGANPWATVGSHHTGGMIGSAKQFATVAASLFAQAPEYHGGGWIGGRQLKPGEVPMIGMQGEQVLTQEQQKMLGKSNGAGMPNVQVNVINNSGHDLDAEQGQPQFNGKDMIVSVVVEAAQKQGPLRDTLKGLARG